MLYDRLAFAVGEAIDRQDLCVAIVDQDRRLIRPIGDEQQQPARRDVAGNHFQQLVRSRIEPVCVLHNHQERLQRTKRRHLFPEDGESLLLGAAAQGSGGTGRTGGDRQERAKDAYGFIDVSDRAGKMSGDLVELFPRLILRAQMGSAAQLFQEWIER